MNVRRVANVGMLLLGVAGVLLCVAGLVGVWHARGRIDQAVARVFKQTDQSLVTVRKFLGDVQQTVRSAKITTREITQRLETATREKTQARIAERLKIDEKVARVDAGLAQADQWVELSISSVQSVRTGLELLQATSIPVDTRPADKLLDGLGTIRKQLAAATESVAMLRQPSPSGKSKLTPRARLEKLTRAGGRLLATVSSLDQQLGKLETRVAGTQDRMHQLGVAALRWLLVVAFALTVLIAWMAAGQVTLALYGWRGSAVDRS